MMVEMCEYRENGAECEGPYSTCICVELVGMRRIQVRAELARLRV